MRILIFGLAIVATTLVVSKGTNKSTESLNLSISAQSISKTENTNFTTSLVTDEENTVSIKEIVSAYLQMKNAFTEDNSTGAATAGKKLEPAFKNFDKSALTTAQKKTYEDVEADAREPVSYTHLT